MLDDHEGKTSTMRVMSFMSLFAAIIFGWFDVSTQNPQPYVTTLFLLGAFCPKALQAFVEKKFPGVKNAEETAQKTPKDS